MPYTNFRWFRNEAIVDWTNVIFSTLLSSIEMCVACISKDTSSLIQRKHTIQNTSSIHMFVVPKCGHITGCFFFHSQECEEGVKACINIDFFYIWIAFVYKEGGWFNYIVRSCFLSIVRKNRVRREKFSDFKSLRCSTSRILVLLCMVWSIN